jgi:hypothetical protein
VLPIVNAIAPLGLSLIGGTGGAVQVLDIVKAPVEVLLVK